MTLPLENLDDKSFKDLVGDAVARIPVYAPGWTDHNKTDPGITLIELLAWIIEMQIYRLNKVSDRSLLKFLKLLGIKKLRPATPAVVDVTFSVKSGPGSETPLPQIASGTQVSARDPMTGEDIIFETMQDLNIVNMNLKGVLTILKDGSIIDNTTTNQSRNAYYNAFGDDSVEGNALYLGLDSSPKGQELALAFYLYQDVSSSVGTAASSHSGVNLLWEYYIGGDWKSNTSWKALTKMTDLVSDAWEAVKDTTSDLTTSGKVWAKVQGDPARTPIGDHDLFWLRIRIVNPGYDTLPRIENILLNTVSAVQKATFILKDSFSSTGLPGLQIKLGHAPVLEAPQVQSIMGKSPNCDRIESFDVSTPRDCNHPLILCIRGERSDWILVEDLDASRPEDCHYSLDATSGIISFGDGIHGRIPSEGSNNITVKFSLGGGIRGNVAPHAINKIMNLLIQEKIAKTFNVDNHKAAIGGKEPETLKEAIGRARKELKTVFRAATPADYEQLTLNNKELGVARVKAIPLYHPCMPGPIPDTITLVVVPQNSSSKPLPQYHPCMPGPVPDTDFLKAVYRFLDKRRTMGIELFVIPPEYMTVSVKVSVVRLPMFRKETIESAICKRLKSFLSPLEGGGPDEKGWPFGRPVYVSELYAVLGVIEGVDYIKELVLFRGTPNDKEERDYIDIPAHGLARSGDHWVAAYTEEEYAAMYVFSWDEIPGKDNGLLIKFLMQKFDIDWVKTAKIEKTNDDKTINVSTEKNSLSLKLNDEKTEVILEIDDGRTNKLVAENGIGKLNIYAAIGESSNPQYKYTDCNKDLGV